MISEHSIVVVTQEQVACDLDGETVILGLEDGVYYGLNAVGTRIWELAQAPRAVHEIIDVLLAEYDVTRDRCTRDVTALLDELAAHNLVRIKNPSLV